MQKVTEYKYLGVLFTNNLLWNKHIDSITRKASARLGFLRRSLKLAPPKLKLLSYKSLVRPLLEYADVIWDPSTASNIYSLEKIQRKAVRFIYNKYSSTDSPTYLCTLADLPTLQTRRKINRMKFLYDIIHKNVKIILDDYSTFSCPRPSRNRNSMSLTTFPCRIDTYKHSFFPKTIAEWNSLPYNISSSPSFTPILTYLTRS